MQSFKSISIARVSTAIILGLIVLDLTMGAFEGFTNICTTGGRCRIDNTRLIISMHNQDIKIVLGEVLLEGKWVSHLWGQKSDGRMVDICVSPELKSARRIDAIINPWATTLTFQQIDAASFEAWARTLCGKIYLTAFVPIARYITPNIIPAG
jgi:hypothetical protein